MKRWACVVVVMLATGSVRADSFDDYNNLHLRKVAESPNAKKVAKVGQAELIEFSDVLPKVDGAMVILRTNDNRWAKALIHPTKQKIDADRSSPTILIERFAAYKEGEERKTVAKGENVRLFDGFRFKFDIGAIVPEKDFVADVVVKVDKDGLWLEPVEKAEMFLVTKHTPGVTPPKQGKVVVGAEFQPALFNGKYKVYDDGRKTGELHLKVGEKNDISGHFFSDATGAKYELSGNTGKTVKHGIFFSVTLPQTTQDFTGWMFTGDARVITGYSTIQGRESGFYAVREE